MHHNRFNSHGEEPVKVSSAGYLRLAMLGSYCTSFY